MEMNNTIVNTRTIAEDYIDSLSRRRLRPLLELFADEVNWRMPGDEYTPWIGRQTSKDEMGKAFRNSWAHTEMLEMNTEYIFAEGNLAMIAGSFTKRMIDTGKIKECLFFIHFRCLNGKIVWYRLLEDSLAVLKAL